MSKVALVSDYGGAFCSPQRQQSHKHVIVITLSRLA